MTDLEQLIDHAAALQREVDRLSDEILAVVLAGLALALACALMGWRLWRAE